ncbi:tetratricopeptide repeat protein [Sporomusa sp.]|uniref:tetratricopeptide repeat protein n=1 Tax=Sporomusa sp. TaxID=2078658 RepID=UPI002B8F420C|nr:tetratricopeptide repeat protein [Sporomusa sp.]HWR45496.1 tetratricopeptide repeat protein [Sporomusa sp.]
MSKIAKYAEASDERVTVSARVSGAAVSILKQYDIPISDVIEAGIIHFLCLDDVDKVAYFLKNSCDVIDSTDLRVPHAAWAECIRDVLNLSAETDVKDEVKAFKAAAKWLPDKGASKINQLSLRKLSATEVVKKADDFVRTGNVQEALSYYDYAAMVLKKSGNTRELGRIHLIVGDAYCNMGNFSLALGAYEAAEAYFENDKNPVDVANLSYSRGVCFQLWGKHKEAYDYFQQARNIFIDIGSVEQSYKTLTRMSFSLDFLAPEEAIKACDEVLDYFGQRKAQFSDKLR